MKQFSQENQEALRQLMKSSSITSILSIKIGCCECGERLHVKRTNASSSDEYELWDSEVAGVCVFCAGCAQKILRSALSGDRAAEMALVIVDTSDDVFEELSDSAGGWVTDDEESLIRARVAELQDEGADISMQVEDSMRKYSYLFLVDSTKLNVGI